MSSGDGPSNRTENVPAPTFKLIVGLGNPGAEYIFTRHNVGFMVLDAWADEDGEAFCDERARYSHLAVLDSGERLVKPMTYMNESGKAVGAWLEWLKLTVADLLVIVDDVALPLGQVRLRPEGSAGGHNGLKSIESPLGHGSLCAIAVRGGWSAPGLGVGALGAVSISSGRRGCARADDPHGPFGD